MRYLVVASTILACSATGVAADSLVVSIPTLKREVMSPRDLGTLVLKGYRANLQGVPEELHFVLQLPIATKALSPQGDARDACKFGVALEYPMGRECVAWLQRDNMVVRFSLEWRPASVVMQVSDAPPCTVSYADSLQKVTACNLGFAPLAWAPISVPFGLLYVDGIDVITERLTLKYVSTDGSERSTVSFRAGDAHAIALGTQVMVLTWNGFRTHHGDSAEIVLFITVVGKR